MRALGAVYGPYTGRCFTSTRETAIEHIVATSEAHDSGPVRRAAGSGPLTPALVRGPAMPAEREARRADRGRGASRGQGRVAAGFQATRRSLIWAVAPRVAWWSSGVSRPPGNREACFAQRDVM